MFGGYIKKPSNHAGYKAIYEIETAIIKKTEVTLAVLQIADKNGQLSLEIRAKMDNTPSKIRANLDS